MSDINEYKCPSCGGAIEFDSHSQKMKCPYCDTEFDLETLKKYDEQLSKEAEQKDDISDWQTDPGKQWQEGETDGMNVYTCKSCGGEIVSDENTGATSCPYCGNPVILTERFRGALRPDMVIPFKLDKKAAKEAYYKHIKGRPLLPKVFRRENHIDEIKGIYVPFWLFDADVAADARYKATKVRTWSDSDYDYKKYIPELNDQFLKAQSASGVEVVTGATHSSESFQNYAQQLIQAAQAGNTDTIEIDNGADLKDGTYKLEEKNYSNGYRVQFEMTVAGGKVTESNFDYIDKDGKSKQDDTEYNENMKAKSGTEPKTYIPTLNNEFVKAMGEEDGSPADVEVVTGATHSSHSFIMYAQQLVNAAEKGDTQTIEVDNIVTEK